MDPVRLETAVNLHEENHAQYERLVGTEDASEHAVGRAPDRVTGLGRPTTRARSLLAQACAANGRAVEALALMEQTVIESSADLGANHPTTWDYRCERAVILSQVGHQNAAVTELREAVGHFADVLGENSATTRRALVKLADTCREGCRFPEAIDAYQRALESCIHTLGTDSPITVRVTRELAELRERSGRTQPVNRVRRLLGGRRATTR